ncbi:hypothetical protein H257_19197 [Aphanomyces astaci]|uniref:Uncharacterized protein n=1 Tax=Aphanomyces astaci TaxID=112090 RepID=W4FAA9_APHAT|nr:hypothetical protein H257_19197 [Aphanomyces astaci]ETV63859.1 hypothetical protein H257_19197 [Aphanomyces astaci]|eukprot:XP_009846652.1 hypothetical protein H257_19197 [Aphanomyces astaci]
MEPYVPLKVGPNVVIRSTCMQTPCVLKLVASLPWGFILPATLSTTLGICSLGSRSVIALGEVCVSLLVSHLRLLPALLNDTFITTVPLVESSLLAVNPWLPTLVLWFSRLWVHEELRGLLKLCLDSLHQLIASVLFGDLTLANTLGSMVTLASNILQPTGIPPHVGLHAQLEQTSVLVRTLPTEICEGIEKILEDKGVTAGNITQSLLEKFLKDAEASVVSLTSASNSTTVEVTDESIPTRPVLGGRWHNLPEGFEMPSADVATAWHVWWCGSPVRGLPPLYKLSSRDMSKKQAKILCEWSFAIDELQKVYFSAAERELGRPINSASVISAFSTIMTALPSSWDRLNWDDSVGCLS